MSRGEGGPKRPRPGGRPDSQEGRGRVIRGGADHARVDPSAIRRPDARVTSSGVTKTAQKPAVAR